MVRLVLVALAVLGLAACSAGVPADFTSVQVGQVSVSYPKDWQRSAGAAFEVTAFHDGKAEARLAVLEKVTKATSARLAGAALQAGRLGMQNYRLGSSTEVEVGGADSAVRVDYTYAGGQGTDLVAVLGRDVYLVRITGRVDPGTVDKITRSVEIGNQ